MLSRLARRRDVDGRPVFPPSNGRRVRRRLHIDQEHGFVVRFHSIPHKSACRSNHAPSQMPRERAVGPVTDGVDHAQLARRRMCLTRARRVRADLAHSVAGHVHTHVLALAATRRDQPDSRHMPKTAYVSHTSTHQTALQRKRSGSCLNATSDTVSTQTLGSTPRCSACSLMLVVPEA